jgi:hypothetical protein
MHLKYSMTRKPINPSFKIYFLLLRVFKAVFRNVVETAFLKNLNFFFFNFFMFSDCFDMLISKIIFLKKLLYFQAKSTINRNRYHTSKHPLNHFTMYPECKKTNLSSINMLMITGSMKKIVLPPIAS